MADDAQGTEVDGLRFSDSVENIAPALLAVQKQIKDPPRSGENPHFGSRYVTLEDLIHAVRPVLSENGITMMQAPGRADGQVTVETILLHESGERAQFRASTPTDRDDPQGIGSAITYLRRYSLAAMLGLAHEDDDDANRATRRQVDRARPKSDTERSGSGSDLTCPDCGSDIWNNLDDDKAAANGGKRPNFKCKDADCDWASWDTEAEVWGEPEPAPEPDDAERQTALKAELWRAFGQYITAEDMRVAYLKAFAQDYVDYPDELEDWTANDFDRALEHMADEGMAALQDLEPEQEVLDAES